MVENEVKKFRRRWPRRFFIHSGILSLFMIGVTSFFYFVLKSDVFIFAVAWAGILFMSEYHYQVTMLPLERKIGRLEGRLEMMKDLKKDVNSAILRKFRKVNKW